MMLLYRRLFKIINSEINTTEYLLYIVLSNPFSELLFSLKNFTIFVPVFLKTAHVSKFQNHSTLPIFWRYLKKKNAN
uniref:Ovule protein n=1 Tax=Heterorhabditis bacteriophora TaxID=37862 RepID=A0A1I7WEU6_HETBA